MRVSCIFGYLTLRLEDGVFIGILLGLEVGLVEAALGGDMDGL